MYSKFIEVSTFFACTAHWFSLFFFVSCLRETSGIHPWREENDYLIIYSSWEYVVSLHVQLFFPQQPVLFDVWRNSCTFFLCYQCLLFLQNEDTLLRSKEPKRDPHPESVHDTRRRRRRTRDMRKECKICFKGNFFFFDRERKEPEDRKVSPQLKARDG